MSLFCVKTGSSTVSIYTFPYQLQATHRPRAVLSAACGTACLTTLCVLGALLTAYAVCGAHYSQRRLRKAYAVCGASTARPRKCSGRSTHSKPLHASTSHNQPPTTLTTATRKHGLNTPSKLCFFLLSRVVLRANAWCCVVLSGVVLCVVCLPTCLP